MSSFTSRCVLIIPKCLFRFLNFQTCDLIFQFLIPQSPEAEVEVVSWDSLLLGYTLALVKTFFVSRFMISFLEGSPVRALSFR